MPGSIVLLPNWIGDLVLSLSVVERKAATGEDLTLLAPRHLVALTRKLTSLPVLSYERDTPAQRHHTLTRLRVKKFDTIYLLPYSFSSGWFAFRTRIKRRRGLAKDGRGILLNDRLAGTVRNNDEHITYEYAAILETEPMAPERVPPLHIEGNPEFGGCIAVCPGATYGPAKRWPYFRELLERLTGRQVVLLGQAGDSDGVMAREQAESKTIQDLCGKTSLVEAARILASARMVVSNDSGLMHIAAYVGTPVTGVFGSTSPKWTRPLGPNVQIAYTAQSCSPCFKRTCRFSHYRCLKAISADDVARICMGEKTG